jgi:hypothetical protein
MQLLYTEQDLDYDKGAEVRAVHQVICSEYDDYQCQWQQQFNGLYTLMVFGRKF